jgi:nitrous oxide reductase accessory protein NosL
MKEKKTDKKRLRTAVFMATLILGGAIATAFAGDDINKAPNCKFCNMDRQKFDFSRMQIEYEDGTSTGLCSPHCAAVELATNIDKTPKAIRVGDFNTKALIDAERAFWVVGGNKPGVMSRTGKWAFEKQSDAEAFIKTNGGVLATFNDAIKAAYNDMYEDTKMIREKRKMKRQGQQ